MATRVRTPEAPGAASYVPHSHSLPVLREAVQLCRGCDLYQNATQAVFGEMEDGGTPRARMMIIGEQPGDREDKQGHPFVGPAGHLLDHCLEQAGIDRKAVFVTNAVKHFKWEPRGKLRIHKKPSSSEIFACRPWLQAELETVGPELIVCLGATAAQALLGPKFKVTESHGTIQDADGFPPILATFHPSSILRAQTDEDRHRQMDVLVADLRKAEHFLRGSHAEKTAAPQRGAGKIFSFKGNQATRGPGSSSSGAPFSGGGIVYNRCASGLEKRRILPRRPEDRCPSTERISITGGLMSYSLGWECELSTTKPRRACETGPGSWALTRNNGR